MRTAANSRPAWATQWGDPVKQTKQKARKCKSRQPSSTDSKSLLLEVKQLLFGGCPELNIIKPFLNIISNRLVKESKNPLRDWRDGSVV